MKRKRRQDPRQTTFEFRPTGRGGARPGAGRPRVRKSRVAHRTREDIPRECPVLVTLRVLDDVPALRRAGFVRAFRESLRQAAERPGFRVVHYSVQDNHAHFLVEADDKPSLANGMKSLGARFARCVNRFLPAQRAGAGVAVPPRGQADADGGAQRGGVRAAERAQALPGAARAEAAGCAGRGELRTVVRRLGRAVRRRVWGSTPTRTGVARWPRRGRGCW